MRRILTIVAAIVAGAALAVPAALAGVHGSRTKIELRRTGVGKILVTAGGFTLFAFSRDARNKDACQNIRHCLSLWPPLTTKGNPIAGPGVKRALVGTIRLRNGAKQVTYAGHPLYTYVGDTSPGQTFYVNFLQFGGFWPAVNASGHEVK